MKKSLSRILVNSLVAGALVFLPVSEGVKRVYAGTEITDNKYYTNLKKEKMAKYGEYLENLIIEKEKRFLVIERHLLKKGEDPKAYFKKAGSMAPSAIFKGNEVRFMFSYADNRGYSEPPSPYPEQERYMMFEELFEYLIEAKQKGYRAFSIFDLNLQRAKDVRQIEIDELIEIGNRFKKQNFENFGR